MFHPIILIAGRWANRIFVAHCSSLERENTRLHREHRIAMQRIADLQGELEDTRDTCRSLMDENTRLHCELCHSIPEQISALVATRGGRHA